MRHQNGHNLPVPFPTDGQKRMAPISASFSHLNNGLQYVAVLVLVDYWSSFSNNKEC